MGNQNDGCPEFFLQVSQQFKNLRLNRDIERGEEARAAVARAGAGCGVAPAARQLLPYTGTTAPRVEPRLEPRPEDRVAARLWLAARGLDLDWSL